MLVDGWSFPSNGRRPHDEISKNLQRILDHVEYRYLTLVLSTNFEATNMALASKGNKNDLFNYI